MKVQFASYLVIAMFALVGVLCGVFMVITWLDHKDLRQHGVETVGTVTDIITSHNRKSTTYAPVVTFTTLSGEKITYESNFYTNINPPRIGDAARLWYDPIDPYHLCLATSGQNLVLLLLVFTLAFGGIGIAGIVWLVRKNKLYRILKERGQNIQATVKEVQKKWWSSKLPYVVVATWVDPITKVPYEFSSDYQSPGLNIGKITSAGAVPVVIDPQNPKQYWMDLSGF